jgi:hypothetical protein
MHYVIHAESVSMQKYRKLLFSVLRIISYYRLSEVVEMKKLNSL